MNIKKLFAILAGVSMVANVVLPGLAHAATPDTELGKAYEWAYSKSITTMPSYEAANMKGKVTRAELAKMLSNWAMNVRGMTPDTSKTCEFTDTASVKGDLGPAIKTSCQLGLMGQGIPAFRPYDNVSRAEFGTALSRALWGGKYDGGTPYYKNHLQALQAAGIMNYIDGNWPASQEVRGYVMLMLMRVAEGDTDTDSETPSEEVVKSGDLSVTATPAEGRKAIVSVSGAVSDLDTLTFKTSEKVDLTKVVLERYGYSSADDVDEIRLEDQDGNVIADGKSLSKDKATLSIKKDYRAIDGTLKATVVAKLTGNNVGGTIGFKVVDVESTAKNLNLDNYTPYTYDMVAYSGNTVTVDIKGTKKDYNYEEGKSYEVARLKVKAGSSIIYVKGFTLKNGSGLDMAEFLDKLTVKVDGKDVTGLKYSVNKDDKLVVSFDEMTIEMNKSALFVISASFKDFDDYGEGVAYYLENDSDINATEKKTGARLTVEGNRGEANSVLHKFNWGKIKLSNNKLGKLDASQWAENLLVAEGDVKVTEPISKLGFTINANGSGAQFVTALRMFVDGDEFEAKKSGTGFTFSNVEIAKSGKIQFKIDIDDNDAAQWSGISFEPNFNGNAFANSKYDNSRETVKTGDVSGTISFSNVTIQPARATLKSNTSSLKDPTEFINIDTTSNDVFKGTYTAKKALINLNKVYMSGANNPTGVNITYYIYLNGEEEYVAAVDSYGTGGEEIFDDVLVEAGKSVDVRVVAEVDAYGSTWSITWVQVVLWGTDEFGKDVEYKAGKLVEMKIVENGSVNVEPGASKNTVYKTSSNQPLAEFTVKAANTATTELTELIFTISGAVGKDDIDLSPIDIDDCKVTPSATGAKVECTELTEKLPSTVSISFNTKKRGEFTVTLDSVNGKKQSRTFSKKFEEALVYIEKQEPRWDETVFTLGIDAADDTIVKDVVLYAGVITGGVNWEFGKWQEVRFVNESTAKYIDRIVYDYELSDGTTWHADIAKSAYDYYFKVGEKDYAKISKASD